MDTLNIDFDVIANTLTAWSPRILAAILILLAFYLLSRILCHLLTKTMDHVGRNEHLTKLFVRSTRILISFVALVTALGTLGVDISALVAGLGLTGFALGFALKDTISNLLSGVLILLHKPFIVGDSITIAGFSGKVERIDLRYTELSADGNKILIPNAKLFTDPITVHAVSHD